MELRVLSVRIRALVTALAIALPGALVTASPPVTAAAAGGLTREIAVSGSASLVAGPTGVDGVEQPEIGPSGSEASAQPQDGPVVDRARSDGKAKQGDDSSRRDRRHREEARLGVSFDGITHRDQRLANNGNQFSLEPPDQGLCAGNGYLLETVNDALRVYDRSGRPQTGVVALNPFYGYAPAINRELNPPEFGPFVTDPSCYFDPDVRRWFHVVLTLDVYPDIQNDFTGRNHLDLAVSRTASPTDGWLIYRIPVQNDGTEGTPNHHCSPGPFIGHPPTHPNACLGDYPHLGADRYGLYITTNEYSFFGPEFKSANLYAMSKRALANGSNVQVWQTDTEGAVNGNPGFTVWPATSPAGQYEDANHGTEYFLSSDAAEEANGTGRSTDLIVWSLSNTSSLNRSPALQLQNRVLQADEYAIPPLSDQKPGDFPLGQCINDTAIPTPFGPGCWRFLFTSEPAHNEVEGPLDSNDTRMQQVVFAGDQLWGALDTAVTVAGENKAGIEWFVVRPRSGHQHDSFSPALVNDGYLAVPHNNVTYPAIGINPQGRGVMAFTLVGADHYPSAAFASLSVQGVGDVQVAAEGVYPQDGFTEYRAFRNPPRPRWGDYGATAVDGDTIWIASEYIGGVYCTLESYVATNLTCDNTRTSLANWYTRVSQIRFGR